MRTLAFILGVLWQCRVPALAASSGGDSGLTAPVVADFTFNDTFADASGQGAIFDSVNTQFDHQALFINGNYEHGGLTGGCRAIADVPALSYTNFTVSIDFWPADFQTNSFTRSPFERVLDRLSLGGFARQGRAVHSTILVGGAGYRWLGFRQADGGNLELTLNNQNFVHPFSGVQVTPRHWHRLVCSVDLGQRLIRTFLDDQPLPVVSLPTEFTLEVIGSDAETKDKQFTFTNYSDGSVFHGFVDNLRVYARALNEGELSALGVATAGERPTFRPVVIHSSSDGYWRPVLGVLALMAAVALILFLGRDWLSTSRHRAHNKQRFAAGDH